MTILYYDCFAGLSGDMNLAAMLDLGIEEDFLRTQLATLGLDREFDLRVSRDARQGIHGTRVDVVLTGGAAHDHGHAHRRLGEIEAIIAASGLSDAVRRTSREIFRTLARAEAKVHDQVVEDVHFHEVGATDAIVDIVGAAICYHALSVDQVWCSPVELGGGFVECAHGRMPVPAPATAEILIGVPTTRGAVKAETTTPTGAAILATLVDRFTATPSLTVEKTAYGVGHRETALPNLVRVQLARVGETAAGWRQEPALLLECNLDDMTPEMLGAVMDLLLEAGAQDVHFTPVVMKKNRPATCLTVLCAPADGERFKRLIFRHTTTLGIKCVAIRKCLLERFIERIDTPLGEVRVKTALLDGEVLRSKPELEDCRVLAQRHGIPLGEAVARIRTACTAGESEKRDP